MTDHLSVWREKLAGVTLPPHDFSSLPSNDDNANRLIAHIVRSDRLSRILAEEATVEGLARVQHETLRTFYPGSIAWDDMYERYRTEHIAAMRACLNHLAQLALEKDHE